MNYPEAPNEIVERAAELFLESEEDVYLVQTHFPAPYPVRYEPYGLSAASIDALLEEEPSIVRTGPLAIIIRRGNIEYSLRSMIPDWRDLYLSRKIAAFALNNYGGPDSAFYPN
jgi:hypothetical protein